MVKEKVKEKIQLVWNDTCNDLEDRFTCVCRNVRVNSCATSASFPSSISLSPSPSLSGFSSQSSCCAFINLEIVSRTFCGASAVSRRLIACTVQIFSTR